jgi:hypothetical protein
MNCKAVIISAIMIFCASFAQAATAGLEADVFYKTAQDNMKSGQYENAIMNAYRAREGYESDGNIWGVQKADTFIGQVEALLQPAQLADMYYNIAGNYFISYSDNREIMQKVIEMATKARDIYARLGGDTGTGGKLKCESLIQRAMKVRDDQMNICIRKGDEFKQKASDTLYMEQYLTAKAYAVNASETYLQCPYQPGVDTAASILSSVNNKINDMQMQARASYEKAVQFYALNTKEGCEQCIQFSGASQELYKKIGDSAGYSTATILATRCTQCKSSNEDEELKQASMYFEEGKQLSIIPDCINATDRAQKAKAIYEKFWNIAQTEEAKLSKNDQIKMNLYNAYLNDVYALMSTITETCNIETMLGVANDYYKQAQDYYLQNNLQEALTYANNAKGLCSQYKNYVCISKCDTLIEQINFRLLQQEEAKNYMKASMDRYNVAELDDALINANRARVVFNGILDRDNVKKADDLIDLIKNATTKLTEGQRQYSIARNALEVKDYDKALPAAKAANENFILVNYSTGIMESDRIIKESEEKIGIANSESLRNKLFFGTLFVVLGIIIYKYLQRQKTLETTYRNKISDEDEKIRRTKEEWSIKADEETKTKVEDELRKLVDAERDKVE